MQGDDACGYCASLGLLEKAQGERLNAGRKQSRNRNQGKEGMTVQEKITSTAVHEQEHLCS